MCEHALIKKHVEFVGVNYLEIKIKWHSQEYMNDVYFFRSMNQKSQNNSPCLRKDFMLNF